MRDAISKVVSSRLDRRLQRLPQTCYVLSVFGAAGTSRHPHRHFLDLDLNVRVNNRDLEFPDPSRWPVQMADVSIYSYVPHRRTQQKLQAPMPPVKVVDQLPHGNPAAQFRAGASDRRRIRIPRCFAVSLAKEEP
jgi:hypothetical protein